MHRWSWWMMDDGWWMMDAKNLTWLPGIMRRRLTTHIFIIILSAFSFTSDCFLHPSASSTTSRVRADVSSSWRKQEKETNSELCGRKLLPGTVPTTTTGVRDKDTFSQTNTARIYLAIRHAFCQKNAMNTNYCSCFKVKFWQYSSKKMQQQPKALARNEERKEEYLVWKK